MSQDKGADGTCETVMIKVAQSEGNPTGIVRINKSDFDESVHELAELKKAKDDGDGKGGAEGGKKEKKAKDDGDGKGGK